MQYIDINGKRVGDALISDEDADLKHLPWRIDHRGYVVRTKHVRLGLNHYTNRNLSLHREVAERAYGPISDRMVVDHVNRDKLDNRRENLRVTTQQNNVINTEVKPGASGYRGVYQKVRTSISYPALIRLDGQRFVIGTFSTAEEAAWMYDQWAIELHGEFAVLNFEYA